MSPDRCTLVDMTTYSLILVPGFWLGGWAWDDVVAACPTGFNVHAR